MNVLKFDLKHTKSYVARETAEFAAKKMAESCLLDDVRVIIAEQDGRFVPVFHLRPGEMCYAQSIARCGFFVMN